MRKLALLVLLVSCKKTEPPPVRSVKPIAPPSDTPIADKAIAAGEAEEHQDPSWLSGTMAGAVARASTSAASTAACRPQRNASRLNSTATPFNAIACSIAAAESGTNPR